MKKTLTVNLNNQVFHIDEDAYDVLKKYLSDISYRLKSNESKDEIMNDIESRIAELFTERLQKSKNVVTIDDVNDIMRIMGNPQQFQEDNEEDTGSDTGQGTTNKEKKKKTKIKHFYRDPENEILGGVASGLAAFLGIDVTIIRIILVLLIVLGVGFIIPIYFIVWFAAPAAITASQRLEMQGEDVTIENIKSEFTNAKNFVQSENFKNTAKDVGQKAGDIVKVLLKIFVGFIGAILSFVGIIVVGVLFFSLFMTILDPSYFGDYIPQWNLLTLEQAIIYIVALLLIISCPLFVLIYGALRIVSKKKNRSTAVFWIALALWVVGIIMFYSVSAKTMIDLKQHGASLSSVIMQKDSGIFVDEERNCSPFHSVHVSSNINLNLLPDSEQKVNVNADESIVADIITDVKDSVLYIYTNKRFYNRKIKADVSTKDLRVLNLSGASRAKTIGSFITPSLKMKVSGAGSAYIDLEQADFVDLDILGASTVNLSGNADVLQAEVLGASKLNAEKLVTNSIKIAARGASSANVFAVESAELKASGASKINCEGNPAIKKESVNGASSINFR